MAVAFFFFFVAAIFFFPAVFKLYQCTSLVPFGCAGAIGLSFLTELFRVILFEFAVDVPFAVAFF